MKINKKFITVLSLLLIISNIALGSDCISLYSNKLEQSAKILNKDTKTAVGVGMAGSSIAGLLLTLTGAPYLGVLVASPAIVAGPAYSKKQLKADKKIKELSTLLSIIDSNHIGHNDKVSLLEMAVGVTDECRPRFDDVLSSLKGNICKMFTRKKHTAWTRSRGKPAKNVLNDTPTFKQVLGHIVEQSQCFDMKVNDGSLDNEDKEIEKRDVKGVNVIRV